MKINTDIIYSIFDVHKYTSAYYALLANFSQWSSTDSYFVSYRLRNIPKMLSVKEQKCERKFFKVFAVLPSTGNPLPFIAAQTKKYVRGKTSGKQSFLLWKYKKENERKIKKRRSDETFNVKSLLNETHDAPEPNRIWFRKKFFFFFERKREIDKRRTTW